jgi:hypothetical protein
MDILNGIKLTVSPLMTPLVTYCLPSNDAVSILSYQ